MHAIKVGPKGKIVFDGRGKTFTLPEGTYEVSTSGAGAPPGFQRISGKDFHFDISDKVEIPEVLEESFGMSPTD